MAEPERLIRLSPERASLRVPLKDKRDVRAAGRALRVLGEALQYSAENWTDEDWKLCDLAHRRIREFNRAFKKDAQAVGPAAETKKPRRKGDKIGGVL